MTKNIAILCLAALITIPAMNAYSATITYTDTGHGSGTLNSIPFSGADFTISATGDTTNRQSFSSGYFIDNNSASIDILGLGAFTFITPTQFFVNNSLDLVGFTRANGGDLYNGQQTFSSGHPNNSGMSRLLVAYWFLALLHQRRPSRLL